MRNQHIEIDNVNLFYREAGDPQNPTIVLLHGYPASSHMFRELIPLLANEYHVLAPDFPGFGFTESPPMKEFDYSFDNLAKVVGQWLSVLGIDRYFLYMQDYGAPIGFRIASQSPVQVLGLIIQNGNAYAEGLTDAWSGIRAYWDEKSPENGEALRQLCSQDFIRLMYTDGVGNITNVAPESWALDSHFLADPKRQDIQIELFHDYQSNVSLYDEWQSYFRTHQPATLLVWGLNDMFFSKDGAEAYRKDLKKVEYHYYETGHFALEECFEEIAAQILQFARRVTVVSGDKNRIEVDA